MQKLTLREILKKKNQVHIMFFANYNGMELMHGGCYFIREYKQEKLIQLGIYDYSLDMEVESWNWRCDNCLIVHLKGDDYGAGNVKGTDSV